MASPRRGKTGEMWCVWSNEPAEFALCLLLVACSLGLGPWAWAPGGCPFLMPFPLRTVNGAHRLFLYPTGRHRTEVFSQHQTHVHITNFHTEAGTIQLHIFSSGECQSDTATSQSHVPRNIAQKFQQVAGLDRLSFPLVAFIAFAQPLSAAFTPTRAHVMAFRYPGSHPGCGPPLSIHG